MKLKILKYWIVNKYEKPFYAHFGIKKLWINKPILNYHGWGISFVTVFLLVVV